MVIHVPQALKADLHEFRLLMLDGKNNRLQNALEWSWIQFEQALSAVLDDVLHKLKEAFSELREWDQVVHYHLQSWLAKLDQNWAQEVLKVLTLLLQDDGKQHQSLRISCIWIRLWKILNHSLQGWQEILVKVCEILLFFNISLYQSQNVFSQRFHRFDAIICSSLSYGLANALWVVFVNHDEIVEDNAEVAQVLISNTDRNSLVYLYDMNKLLDRMRLH